MVNSTNYRFTQPATTFAISNVQIEVPAQQEISAEAKPTISNVAGYPVQLEISSLNVQSVITEAQFNVNKNTWDVSDSNLNYIKEIPGEKSVDLLFTKNIIIYGHNTKNLLGNLKNSKDDTVVKIYTSDGYEIIYIYYQRIITKPSDISIFHQKFKDPNLSIITCDGPFDSNRLIANFKLIDIKRR